MRSLEEMLESLVGLLLLDDARQEHAVRSFARASEVARRLPLVHRTNKPGDDPAKWSEVLRSRTFTASAPCTGDREKAAGIPRAAYFFVGCGAYPDGLVGFVLDAPSVLTRPSSYTPFDSGSIEKHAVPSKPALAAAWDGPSKDRFLAAHVGRGYELVAFSGPYLASLFREPLEYVRGRQTSDPDFPAEVSPEPVSLTRLIASSPTWGLVIPLPPGCSIAFGQILTSTQKALPLFAAPRSASPRSLRMNRSLSSTALRSGTTLAPRKTALASATPQSIPSRALRN